MTNAGRAVARRVEELIEKVLEREGFEIVDIEFTARRGGSVLTIFIDREGGVDLDACAFVSEIVGPILDAHNVIAGRYFLEVSSPGIERPLRKAKDFARFAGETVVVSTVEPVRGRKNFKGTLVSAGDASFVVEVDGVEYEIPYESIKKARLHREIRF
jgi:ribosome maturation factor RimP